MGMTVAELVKTDTDPETLARASVGKFTAEGQVLRIAYSRHAVGAWITGEWRPLFNRTIMPDFPWVYAGGRDTLVNGEKIERDWIEVTAEAKEAA